MTAELETWCQCMVKQLLQQKDKLLKRRGTSDEDNAPCNLPHYNTVLETYRAIEKQELLLLVINDKIQSLERERELENVEKSLCSFRIKSSDPEQDEESFLQDWMLQILKHNKEEKKKDSDDEVIEDCLFYDLHFHESLNSKKETFEHLTWSTRYKGRCVRVSVCAPPKCRTSDLHNFTASFYVNGLVTKGKEYISGGRNVDEYVKEVLWAGLQELIDIS